MHRGLSVLEFLLVLSMSGVHVISLVPGRREGLRAVGAEESLWLVRAPLEVPVGLFYGLEPLAAFCTSQAWIFDVMTLEEVHIAVVEVPERLVAIEARVRIRDSQL